MPQNQTQQSSKPVRLFARALSYVLDNPGVHILTFSISVAGMRGPNPAQAFLLALASVGLFVGYIYLGRKGMSPVKALFGMQVVSTETGKPIGFGKMFLRDFVVNIIGGFVFMYFGLLMMSAFKPSTARNRYEERLEDAERAVATAAAVGSVVAAFKTDALFKHDSWFKTTVVNVSYAEIKQQFSSQPQLVQQQQSQHPSRAA